MEALIHIVLIATIVNFVLHAINFKGSHNISNDGQRYLRAGKGELLYHPFHKRWLLPYLLKDSKRRWIFATTISLLLIPVLTYLYLLILGLSAVQAAFGALLFLGLQGVFRYNIETPVHIDSAGILLSLCSAVSFLSGLPALGVLFVVLAGCVKESMPMLTLLFSMNPLALIGFASPLYCKFFRAKADNDFLGRDRFLNHPISCSLRSHRYLWFNSNAMLLPWGVCILSLLELDWWLLAAFAVGYGQLALASDNCRLYHQVFPVIVYYTALAIPQEYYPLVLVLHWYKPWGGGKFV